MLQEIPASHQSLGFSFPTVEYTLFSFQERVEKINILEAFEKWKNNVGSNLLVLMGDFGTGKTTSLKIIERKWKKEVEFQNFDHDINHNEGTYEYLFENLRLNQNSIVLIDNFDSVNSMTGILTSPPDLRILKSIAQSHKVVIATRRTFNLIDDELVSQLNSKIRLSNLGFNNPFILQHIPWTIDDLIDFGKKHNDQKLLKVTDFLQQLPSDESSLLGRPLLISMLLDIIQDIQEMHGSFSISKIYELYSNFVLANDFDKNRSKINGKLKKEILCKLAFDLFTGLGSKDYGIIFPLSITIGRISERVLEIIMKEPSIRNERDLLKYSWTDDFLITNHFIEERKKNNLSKFGDKEYSFSHQSYYEYFVSLEFLKRISNGIPFELTFDNISSATVHSLSFVFTKEFGGKELRIAIKNLIKRPKLSAADRLILFYFLEDDEEFEQIFLKNTNEDYFIELEKKSAELEKERNVDGFFLNKMIKYQLIFADRFTQERYILDLKNREDGAGIQTEQRLHSSENSVTMQLIERLNNPSLQKARKITIYRLGQFGDSTAISVLRTAATYDQSVKENVEEAITEINRRHNI